MSQLVDEVLYEVFKCSAIEDPINGPLVVSHCCQRWRHIAVGSPLLWTRIIISQPRYQHYDRLLAWLNRSKDSTLDIEISNRKEGNYTPFISYFNVCLGMLAHQSSRWGKLWIGVDSLEDASRSLIFSRSLPLLTDLSVNVRNHPDRPISFHGINAPRLRKLEINQALLLNNELEGWSGVLHEELRSLRVLGPSTTLSTTIPDLFKTYFNILRSCRMLETVIIVPWFLAAGDRSFSNRAPEDIIEMPNLKTLDIKAYDGEEVIGCYLLHIRAPRLAFLEAPLRTDHIIHIISLPIFPCPALQFISLLKSVFVHSNNDDAAIKFLSQLPQLQRLRMNGYDLEGSQAEGSGLLNALVTICPQLEGIILVNCGGDTIMREVRKLIEARNGASVHKVCKIVLLHIEDNRDELSQEDMDWFEGNVPDFRQSSTYGSPPSIVSASESSTDESDGSEE